jgi:hypothetical protein
VNDEAEAEEDQGHQQQESDKASHGHHDRPTTAASPVAPPGIGVGRERSDHDPANSERGFTCSAARMYQAVAPVWSEA